MKDTYRFIGKRLPRKDGIDIVTGATMYRDDIKLPHLLHGMVLRSPHAHARIVDIDTTKAKSLPGVEAVLTWKDVPDWKGGQGNTTRILDEKVRFVGDVVALVAATNKQIAADALRFIEVEYETLPAVFDLNAAMAPDATPLYAEYPGNVLPGGVPGWGGEKSMKGIHMGDVHEGFEAADTIVEDTYAYENIPNPLPPEAPGAIALWEHPNQLKIWVSDQAFYKHVGYLKRIFGNAVDVRTFGGPCGASFGSKSMSWQPQLYAGLLSKATGKPVKVAYTKEEHLAAFVLRPASKMRVMVGMKRDGSVTAISGMWMVGTGYYSQTTQAQVAVGCGEAQLAIRCPNWDLATKVICTNRSASGIVRGFGGQELKCAIIPTLSQAMHKLDIDPVAFFKKNFVKNGDGYFWRDGEWYIYRGVDHAKAIEKGALRFGWKEKWKGWLNPTSVNGSKRRGIGVCSHGNSDIGEDTSEAQVRLDPDATAKIFSAITEHGTGQKTNIDRMVAEVLQIPMEWVFQAPSDSFISPHERGPGGSRGTYATGSAIIAAAEDARRQLLDLASVYFEVAADQLDTVDGMVFPISDPDAKVPWGKIMGVGRTLMGYGRFEPDFTLSNCMTTFVEVEVDTMTGKVCLVDVVNATDVGQIIDPPGLEGQLNGCLGAAGIDSSLFEETIIDQSTGHMLNANMIDYKWRTFSELPPIANEVLESSFDSHRFRAVGVGEVATSPGPVAINMAVSNAIGAWMREYPTTPERVLKALGKITERKNKRKGGAA